MRRFTLATSCLAVSLLAPALAQAADLVFGRATEQSSLDPQFSQTGPNEATSSAIYGRLVTFDPHLQMHPGLALSWKPLDPLNWEIKLRPGVKFQDGTPFTATDMAYSLNRARNIPGSPAPYSHDLSNVAAIDVVDPLTLHIRTPQPTPLLMQQIGLIYALPAKLGANVSTTDFNTGKAAIGTGPYRLVRWIPADRLELVANPDWWGGKPAFDHVTLRFIPGGASRTAALLSGQVQLMDEVPPADQTELQRAAGIKLYSSATNRIIYLALDAARTQSPFITDKNGKPMDANPLQKREVRLALSKLINRDAITERLLNGAAVPAGQIVPEGEGGYDPALKPVAYDLAGAKAMLAKAGYPDGFGLTLHTSSDRYPSDAQVMQAIGQMFSRGGLRINGVEALPYSVFAGKATARSYSAFLFGWASATGNSAEALRSILATYDPKNGMGALNRTRYSNPAFDALLQKATSEFDETKRNAELASATAIAIDDGALLPLYWQKAIWAARTGIAFDANMSEDSSILYAHPAP